MSAYILRRALLALLTLFGVTVLVFSFIRLTPGSPADAVCAGTCTPDQVRRVEDDLGLHEPLPLAYLQWVGGLLKGDLGSSLLEHVDVTSTLSTALPVTFELGMIGIIIGTLIAVPIGVVAAVKQDSWIDYLVRSVSVGMIAAPSFWLAMLIITASTKYSLWTPQLNYVKLWVDPVANFKIMWLPGLLLGITLSGTLMRLTRTQMLEVIREDYIRTARAKGLSSSTVLIRHALRNASIPIITLIGLQVPIVVGGSVILETIFSLPGVGRLAIGAIRQSDYPVIQGVNLVLAVVVVTSSLVVDVCYGLLDPRLRHH